MNPSKPSWDFAIYFPVACENDFDLSFSKWISVCVISA